MKLILEDPELGKREINLDSTVALIKDQLRLLESFRDDGRTPKPGLLEDIQVYKYIIEHPQAEQKARDYMDAMNDERDRRKTMGIPKMVIARKLGWFS